MRVLWLIQRSDFIDPMGICYLSAVAKSAGHEMDLAVIETTDIHQRIRDFKPQVVAYSAVTGEHQSYFNFNRELMRLFPDIFTIMGGAHPTFYPKCVDYQPIHAIAVGEGEGAFVELLDRLEHHQDIGDIRNIGTRIGGLNPKRNLIGDLDTLPFPDRDLLFGNTEIGKFPLKAFMTSRGCPYPCTYCFEPVLKKMYREEKAFGPIKILDEKTNRQSGRYERRHSPERVCEEILLVKPKWPLEFIKFEDDLFVLQADPWLYEFTKLYSKRIRIPFNALVRVDSISEEMLKLLKEAGCVSLNISVDSANQEIRKRVVKKRFTNQDVVSRFRLAESYGINVFNNMILALPDSTIEDDKDAVRLDIAAGVKSASFTILMPYPGTEIGQYCSERGYFDADPDKLGDSLFERSPLTCFTEEEKSQQKNILYLGGLAVFFGNSATWAGRKSKALQSSLRTYHLSFLCFGANFLGRIWQKFCSFATNLILERLIYINGFTRLYSVIFYILKVLTLKYYIFPIKFRNPVEGIRNFLKGFRIEVLRTTSKTRK